MDTSTLMYEVGNVDDASRWEMMFASLAMQCASFIPQVSRITNDDKQSIWKHVSSTEPADTHTSKRYTPATLHVHVNVNVNVNAHQVSYPRHCCRSDGR
jgi:hypothetical protein